MRAEGSPGVATKVAHLIDYYCRKQRHVTRSTFGAELYAACDAADHSMLLAQILHEVEQGTCTASAAKQLRETGSWAVTVILGIDAMSVYSGVTATVLKIPAEKGLWSHVQYLRELLDIGVLNAIWWIDTRDMHSDGLTKGSVDRGAIHAVMQGTVQYKHLFQEWKPKKLGAHPGVGGEDESLPNLVLRL